MIDKMFPTETVAIIMESWNEALTDALQNGNGTQHGKRVSGNTRYSKRLLSDEREVYHLLGVILLCCLTQKSKLKLAFDEVSESGGNKIFENQDDHATTWNE